MMKMLLATAAVAAIGIAAPAFAQDAATTSAPSSKSFSVTADNPAKCQINADQTSVTLADDSISNDQGRARANIGQKVAQALDGLNAHAWCTGASNGLVLTRSSLITGDGTSVDGFAQAVIYDIAVDLSDASRQSGTKPVEGTADGGTNGPGVGSGSSDPVSHFGPTGQGSKLKFSNEAGSTSEATTVNADGQRRDFYTPSNARLTSGSYTGTVTLTLTPNG